MKKNIGAKQNKKRNRTRSVENESEQQERNQNWVSFIIIGRAAEKTAIILNQLASHYAYRLVIVNLDTFYMPAYKCISILAWYLFNRKKKNKDNGEWRRWKKKELKQKKKENGWGPEETAVVEVEGLVGRDDSIEEARC